MSQPTVAAYFNTRKRVAVDDISSSRNKVYVIENNINEMTKSFDSDYIENAKIVQSSLKLNNLLKSDSPKPSSTRSSTQRVTRSIKRIGAVNNIDEKCHSTTTEPKQPKLVKFLKMGNLSPQKKVTTPTKVSTPVKKLEFSEKSNTTNMDKGMKTPTKQTILSRRGSKDISSLPIEEIKARLSKSSRLTELKTSLNKLQNGLDRLDRMEKTRKEQEKPVKNLKEFKTIELEVLSPSKTFTSPIKRHQTPPTKQSSLMSPRKEVTPKKLIFSPIKEGSTILSPKKLPAYQRFQNLAESSRPTLQMPYKYRCLSEMFKCLDTVCAMFFNRKEKITFKKIKPAVQRMLRKNVYESHLAQIQHLFPDAYIFTQEKTRNYGSATKQDHFQLVIVPNVQAKNNPIDKLTDDTNLMKTAQNQAMNPQIMIDRCQKFHKILLEKVKDEHEKFLLGLNPPMRIQREKLTRWHPEFNLESCPDIQLGDLPQPPDVEKFSTAKDILSTARNLFNCNTPMERALERLEAKKKEEQNKKLPTTNNQETDTKTEFPKMVQTEEKPKIEDPLASTLKNVPKSLLEKIRAKQAAKALDQMTRRPSEEKEAIKYGRLPEIARHVRNVFVTEKKSVLPLDQTLIKIENSYRGKLNLKELEEHLKAMSTLVPTWITFHEVRKTVFVKIAKDADLSKVVGILEKKANSLVK